MCVCVFVCEVSWICSVWVNARVVEQLIRNLKWLSYIPHLSPPVVFYTNGPIYPCCILHLSPWTLYSTILFCTMESAQHTDILYIGEDRGEGIIWCHSPLHWNVGKRSPPRGSVSSKVDGQTGSTNCSGHLVTCHLKCLLCRRKVEKNAGWLFWIGLESSGHR